MPGPLPPWLASILTASVLRRRGVFIGLDCLALPVGREDAFIPVRPLRRVVSLQSGARFVREDKRGPTDIRADVPIVLLTEGMSSHDVSGLAGRLGRAPDVVLHTGDTCPLDGFRQVIPDLFVNKRVNGFIQDLVTLAERHLANDVDAYDTLQNGIARLPILRHVAFDVDGNAWLELSVVPLVRGLDAIMAEKLVLRGMVDLNRWRRVTLRVPVFGLKTSNVRVRFAGNTQSCVVENRGSDDGIVASAQVKSGDCVSLRLKPSHGLKSFIDLEVTGHAASVDQVSVQLPTAAAQSQDPQVDELDQFADPLDQYG